jgi:D-alanyl-D-alanine carboxypeptidase
VATALVGVIVCAVGLTAVAGAPPPPVGAMADPSGPAGTGASPDGTVAPSGSAVPMPSPSVAPTPVGPTFAELRAIAVRGILQRQLDESRERLGIPGVSVTIIFRDGSTWTGSSGRSDVRDGVDVDEHTAFAIASVSKTYTAALILALAGDGEIDLDASARTYLPEAAIDPRITVRQLLDHTSGLDDYFLHPPIDRALQAEPARFWSARRTLGYVGKPYFPPGAGWHYSNTNYLYLGLIAERVTGVTLATALRERLFTPLGLEETWYQAVEKPRGPLAHGYRFASAARGAAPIDLSDGTGVAPFTSVVTAAAGAGSIAATSSDVARWARLLYSGEVLGGEMTTRMIAGVAATAGYRPRVPYGLGVQSFRIDDRVSLGHSGRLLGFRSAVRHFPGENLTISILTNQSRADPGIVLEDLLEIVFRADGPCHACQRPA